jgi:hypothetical protein
MDSRDIQSLITDDARRCIDALSGADPHAVALAPSPVAGLPARAIAEQLACRRKAHRKLPTLSRRPLLYDSRALEQCSSEATARHKARLLTSHSQDEEPRRGAPTRPYSGGYDEETRSRLTPGQPAREAVHSDYGTTGYRALDMTGGLGIDTLFLASVFTSIDYCEAREELAELFRINAATLEVDNVAVHSGDALETLSRFADDTFDWIHVDPSRRPRGRREVSLERCEPDVVASHELLLRKSPRVCIKTSPLLESREAVAKVGRAETIEVVSVEGECREQLLLLNRNHPPSAPVTIRAVLLTNEGAIVDTVSGTLAEGTVVRPVGRIGSWLYDPDAAVVKARLAGEVARRHGFGFVNERVDYMTSNELAYPFPGRVFTIVEVVPWSRGRVRDYLRSCGIGRANIARREFPMAPDRLRSMLRVGEGGEEYLFFTRDGSGAPLCIHCRRHHPPRRCAGSEA